MTDQEILSATNGLIVVTATEAGEYKYDWIGGPLIGVAWEFLQTDPPLARIEGETVFVGPYRARIIQRGDRVLLAERVS